MKALDQVVIRPRLALLQCDAPGEGGLDAVLVPDACQLRMAHHLGLEPIGQNVVHIVLHQVAGNGIDAVLGLQNVAGGAVLLLDGEQLVLGAVLEQVFELAVKFALLVQGAVGCLAFVQDLQRGAIVDRIHQSIGVDVFAKALVRLLLAMALCQQRGAGKGHARRVGKSLEQVVSQVRALGPVGLVDQQDDAVRSVDHAEGLA